MAQAMTATETMETPNINTPAVSARVLKKRETDRRCQRMIRERTKSRIAYLEGLVEQFRQQDSSGRVETLMKQLSDMKDERDNLAKKVKNIESIISDGRLKEEPESQSSPVAKASAQLEDSEAMSAVSVESHRSYPLPPTVPVEPSSIPGLNNSSTVYQIHNKEYAAYIENPSRSSWATSTLQSCRGQPCECSTNCSALDPSLPLNKWRYANDTLTEWFKWSPQALNMHQYEAYNDDIPVRAVVEGWDAVEKQGYMHPCWRLLKAIDQTIFVTCGPRERLAILQTMGLLLQAHMNPTKEQESKLPMFYLKRPSQDMLHSYATEYFIWPGLRERFVFSEHRYCSNTFWQVLCPSLQVQWPYEFRDCYIRNTETGLYRVSPAFQERISDVQHWTMGMDMFKQYPELYGDIPAHNHIPASITPVLGMHRQIRRALPPATSDQDIRPGIGTPDNEHVKKKRKSIPRHDDYQSPVVLHESALPLPPQTIATQFSPLSTESYDHGAVTTYDYSHPNVVANLADMHNLQAMTPWGYNQNLDMFQLHPA